MDLGLQGRVAIVCAASQGLGKATATGFAREGAHVVVCSRNKKPINAAAKEIRESVPEGDAAILPVVADLRKARDQGERAVSGESPGVAVVAPGGVARVSVGDGGEVADSGHRRRG